MSAGRGLDAVRVGLLVLAVAGHGLWLASLAANQGEPELLRRDFIVVHEAGRATPDALYAPRPFPFLYPPPVAALARALAPLPPLALYAGVLLLDLAALGALLAGLGRLGRSRPAAPRDVLALGALACAPWTVQLILGQPAALWPALWVLGLCAARRWPALAGGLWSLAGLKPVFLGGALLLALAQGRRAVLGLALGLSALVAGSLWLGPDVWVDWLAALRRGAGALEREGFPLFKQHTVYAALLWLRVPAAGPLTALLAVGFAGAAWRVGRARSGDRLWLASVLALGTVAFSPYLYFYDALLLLIPAGRLWLRRPPGHRLAAVFPAALLLLQPVVYFGLQAGSPFGLVTAAWLAIELRTDVTERRDVGSVVPAHTDREPQGDRIDRLDRSLLR